MRVYRIYTVVVLVLFFSCLSSLNAENVGKVNASLSRYISTTRHPAFREPQKLRKRVNFWIDIFTIYDSDTLVFHHRDYPQAVFDVVDLGVFKTKMSERSFKRYRDKVIKRKEQEIVAILRRFAQGKRPTSKFEHKIYKAMELIPGGREKYSKTIHKRLIRAQSGIKDEMRNAIIRSGRYIPLMEEIFRQEGLPIELTRLPLIESAFNYKAYSSKRAAGIWQFIPRTARLFGLKVGRAIDERRDPVLATKAAAKYLKFAYSELKSWPLAVISYNHGIYGVKKAVRMAGTSRIEDLIEYAGKRRLGFASNNFYPEFLAALEVYENRRDYFPDIRVYPTLRFEEVRLKTAMPVSHILRSLKLRRSDLEPLNYGILEATWRGRYYLPAGYRLRVPPGYKRLALNLRAPVVRSASSIYGGAQHKVRRGETLISLAQRYNTTVKKIKELNGIKGTTIRVGQILTVRAPNTHHRSSYAQGYYTVRRGDTLISIAKRVGLTVRHLKSLNGIKGHIIRVGDRLRITQSPTYGRVYHTVRKGDSLWKLSKNYGVSIASIKRLNGLRGSYIRYGQRLRIR